MAWRKNSAALLALLFCLSGAEPAQLTRYTAEEVQMGTVFRITLYAPSDAAAQDGFAAVFARVAALNQILSDYREDSELIQVCRSAYPHGVAVSNDLFQILSLSQVIAHRSKGAFDVTLGPLTRLWRDARRQQRLPNSQAVAAARARTGFRHLHLNATQRTVRLDRPDMLLDLGGIAKGYAAEEALRVLEARGLQRALVAASGDLAVGDPPPDAPGWRVGVGESEHGGYGRILLLHNLAVSTSGDAEQALSLGGQHYSHIIQPRSGQGVTTRITATVLAPRGATADALATTLSVMGLHGLSLIERTPGTAALLLQPGQPPIVSTRFNTLSR